MRHPGFQAGLGAGGAAGRQPRLGLGAGSGSRVAPLPARWLLTPVCRVERQLLVQTTSRLNQDLGSCQATRPWGPAKPVSLRGDQGK